MFVLIHTCTNVHMRFWAVYICTDQGMAFVHVFPNLDLSNVYLKRTKLAQVKIS